MATATKTKGLELWEAARPAQPAAAVEHVPYSFGRKPIAEHNAELAAHMEKYFPADPGKSPRVFRYDEARQAYLALSGPLAEAATPQAGFLNYDDKFEMLDGLMLVRRDMTDAEFEALPEPSPKGLTA